MKNSQEPKYMTPGPLNESAVRAHFERGSAEKLLGDNWRNMCFLLILGLIAMAFVVSQLLPLKTVEVYIATKQDSGRVVVEESSPNWTPDQDVVQYFLSDWVSNLTEVNPASWERTTARAIELTVGTGTDQTKDFLRKPDNNPALLLKNAPNYIRTYELVSSNILKEGSSLIRFRTVSRNASSGTTETAAFAVTINYIKIKPTNRKQALSNPTGLAIASFNISEESGKK
jgi:type IV secretory pathway component VirB8